MLFNQSRAERLMEDGGLDVIVVSSPVNITYFTGYTNWLEPLFREYMGFPGASSRPIPSYAVFSPVRGVFLVVNPMFAANAADLGGVKQYTYAGASIDFSSADTAASASLTSTDQVLLERFQACERFNSPTGALVGLLCDLGLSKASIGLEAEGLGPGARQEIENALPGAQVRDCPNMVRIMRMVKSHEEIRFLEKCAGINERGAKASLRLAKPGTRLAEFVQEYRRAVAEMGADFDHYAYGVRGTGIATRAGCSLRDKDFLYLDFGCIYRGYFSDAGITLVVGDPAPGVLGKYQALVECQERALENAQPGVRVSRLADAMQDYLRETGITSCFPHGHGVGLEVRDYPIIVPDNGLRIRDDCVDVPSDLKLEENMVINLEAGLFLFGVGSLQCERTFLITSHGYRPLVPQGRAQPLTVS